MKFTDEEGKVWEWRGEYHAPKTGEHFLSVNETIRAASPQYGDNSHRAIVHPIRPIHGLQKMDDYLGFICESQPDGSDQLIYVVRREGVLVAFQELPERPIHEFGGVKFEETGEERVPQNGEWFLIKKWGTGKLVPYFGVSNEYIEVRPILRPL